MLLRPNRNSKELVNLSVKAKRYEVPTKDEAGHWQLHNKRLIGFSNNSPEMVPNDSWVYIRNSELCAGTMDKNRYCSRVLRTLLRTLQFEQIDFFSILITKKGRQP